MRDWEDAILDRQESESEDCLQCPYKGIMCRSQCMEICYIQNPYLTDYQKEKKKMKQIEKSKRWKNIRLNSFLPPYFN